MAKDDNVGKKLAIGAAIAGITGYLAGILTAPKSGKETRSDIADKADEVVDSAQHELHELEFELKDLLSKAKNETAVLKGKSLEELNEAVLRAKDAQKKTTTLAKSIKAGEAENPELNKAIKQGKLAAKNLKKYLKS